MKVNSFITLLLIIFFNFGVAIAQGISVEYQSFDGQNVLLFGCDYQKPFNRMYINVLNVRGGTGSYTVTASGTGEVSSPTITTGQGFTYFFTEQDQASQSLDFTIRDSAGRTYNLDPLISTQLELLQFGICATPNYTCRQNISHNNNLVIAATTYNAQDVIESNGTVLTPSNAASYLSGDIIELQPGFEVPLNATFLADIQTCSP